jgi:hypothetical protein
MQSKDPFHLSSLHLLFVFGLSELGLQLFQFSSECCDFVNQFDILRHDVLVVLFVDHVLFLKLLNQRVVRLLQVALLIDVLFLDVRVDVGLLLALPFHIRFQRGANRLLQHIDIVNVLDHPVNRGFEVFDVNVIPPDFVPRRFNQFEHLLLPRPQIVYNEAQLTVHNVELS